MTKIFKMMIGRAALLFSLLCFVVITVTSCESEVKSSLSTSIEEVLVGNSTTNATITVVSNTNWTAKSNSEWCRLSTTSGRGTTEVQLLIEPHHGAASRIAEISIAAGDGKKTTIRVIQTGIFEIKIRVSPTLITVGPKPSAFNSFSAAAQYSDAVISATVKTGGDWLKNLEKVETVPSGFKKTDLYVFDVNENVGAEARQATIEVVVKWGDKKEYTEVVTVHQNGLGAPAVSTPSFAYMTHSQKEHKQSLWVEGGDQTNVRYDVTFTSHQSGVDASRGWITNATVVDHQLIITGEPNTYDEMREGDVVVVAFRGDVSTKLNIHVSQSGYKAPGMTLPTSIISHNAGAASYSLPIIALNGSTITVIPDKNSNDSWLKDVKISNNSSLDYTIDAYNGQAGETREAKITLMASNGHSNSVYYYVTVSQIAPMSAGIAGIKNTVTHNFQGGTFFMPLEPINGSTITVVGSYDDWVRGVVMDGNVLRYSVDRYDGSFGETRETVITVKAKNAHVNPSYYYITVRQQAPLSAGMDGLVTRVAHSFEKQKHFMPINALNNSVISISSVDAQWLTATVENGRLEYSITEYNGGEKGESREAVISIMAHNSSHNAAYYYITVVQHAPSAAGISELPTLVTLNHEKGATGKIYLNTQNNSTVRVYLNCTWLKADIKNDKLTYTADLYTGDDDFRETVMEVTAKNSHDNIHSYYITVRQYAQRAAGISGLPSRISNTFEAGNKIVDLSPMNKSKLTVVSFTNAGMFSGAGVKINNKNQLIYTLTKFAGPESTRESLVTIEAKNSNNQVMYYSLVIAQTSPLMPAISNFPAFMYHGAEASSHTINLSILNKATLELVGTTGDIFASATPPSSSSSVSAGNTPGNLKQGVIKYSIAENVTGYARVGTITVKVSTDNANVEYYTLTIKQDHRTVPGISELPSMLTFSSKAFAGVKVPFNVIRGAVFNDISVSTDAPTGMFSTDPTVSSTGGSNITFGLTEFNGPTGTTREAIITVKVKSSGYEDASFYYLKIVQMAPGAPAIAGLPNVRVYSASDSGLKTFLFKTENTASVSVNKLGDDTFITSAEILENKQLQFNMSLNKGVEDRESQLIVTAVNGDNATSYPVVIRQKGLGEPIIVGLSDAIYIDQAASTFKQSGLVLPNIGAGSVVCSSPSSFISDVKYSSGELTFTYAANPNTTPRAGSVVLTATNGSYSTSYCVKVIQGTVGTPKLSGMPDEIVYSAADAGAKQITFDGENALNVTVKVENGSGFVTGATIVEKTISYTVSANTGADDREAVLVVTAKNGVKVTSHSIKIRQKGLGVPVISGISDVVYVAQDGGKFEQSGLVLPNLGAGVVTCTSQGGFITNVKYDAGKLTFDYAANAKSTPRAGSVVLIATNGAHSTSYCVKVVQSTVDTPTIEGLPTKIVYSAADEGEKTLSFVSSNITGANISVSVVGGATGILSSEAVTESQLSYTLKKNAGANDREVQLVITAKNGIKTITREINVLQKGIGHPIISGLADVIYVDQKEGTFTQSGLNLPNDGSVTCSSQNSFIKDVKYELGVLSFNYEANPRETLRMGTFILTVANGAASTSYCVKVVQGTLDAPTITGLPDEMVYNAADHGAKAIAIECKNASEVTVALVGGSKFVTNPAVSAEKDKLTFNIPANTGATEREISLVLTAKNAVKTGSYTLKIRQIGSGEPTIAGLADVINIDQLAGTFTQAGIVLSNSSTATVSSWSPFITNATLISGTLSFSYSANPATTPREGSIVLTAKTGSYSTSYSVKVVQGTTGIPKLASLPDQMVYSASDEGAKTVSFNCENSTDITVELAGGATFVTLPSITGKVLSYTLSKNTGVNDREVSLVITAKNGLMVDSHTMKVIQKGLGSPVISGLVDVISVEKAAGTFTQSGITFSSGSTVKVSSVGSFITDVAFTAGTLSFNYSVNSTTNSRLGSIVLTATNGATTTSYSVKVVQNASTAPTLVGLPDNIVYSAVDNGAKEISFKSPGATSLEIKVLGSANFITDESVTGKILSYTLSANTGSADREVSLLITASNASGSVSQTVKVRQLGLGRPVISGLVDVISVEKAAGTFTQSGITFSSGSTVKVSSVGSFITDVAFAVGTLSFNYSANSTTNSRLGSIVLTATNGDITTSYSVKVVQNASAVPTLVGLPDNIVYSAVDNGVKEISFKSQGATGLDIKVLGSANFITDESVASRILSYTLSENTGSADREVSLLITATNASGSVSQTVKVRQLGVDKPTIVGLAGVINIGKTASTFAKGGITSLGGTVTVSSWSPFISNPAFASGELTFDYAVNTAATTRVGSIVLTVTNATSGDSTSYPIVVIQDANI